MQGSGKKKLRILIFLLFLIQMTPFVAAQSLGVKTNLLWWLTTTPNLGVELAVGRHLTLDLSANYNAWTFLPKDMSLRHWAIQPEVRYWPRKAFEGHFFGMHANYAKYNIGQIPFISGLDDYTLRGDAYGGGISFGYHFAIGRRWGLELSAGLGYTYLEYNKYVCAECAELMGRYKRHFYGPTRLSASIIYLIH